MPRRRPDLLARAAQRAREYPEFMAYLLARYQALRGLTDEQLAAELGCTPQDLTRLALCLRPRPDHLAEDIAQIAGYVKADPARLANLVRVTEAALAAQATSASGRLLAARELPEPPSEEGPSEPPKPGEGA